MNTPNYIILLSLLLLSLPLPSSSSSSQCTQNPQSPADTRHTLALKLGAIASILASGALGILIPILSKRIPSLRPETDAFLIIKSFAAGVILATGMIHILPNAFERLTSPCLEGGPWRDFPFAGFVAMGSAVATMMVDCFATGYYRRSQISKALPVDDDADVVVAVVGVEHGHGHGHGHGHAAVGGAGTEEASVAERIRHRVVSQVRLQKRLILYFDFALEKIKQMLHAENAVVK